MSEITLVNGAAPSTPSAGRVAVFSDSADKHLKTIDDAGLIVDLTDTGASGAASGDLAGTYPAPSVAAMTTTTGPTSLTIGAIAAGETLRRVGSTIVGYTPASGGGWSVVTETTLARAAMGDEFILVDVATCSVTLPAAVADLKVALKTVTSPTDVRLLTSGAGVLIDGTDYSAVGLELKKQYETISVISDGTDWFIY